MSHADAHLHLFAGGYPGRYGHALDELAAYEAHRAAHDISAALVIGFEGAPGVEGTPPIKSAPAVEDAPAVDGPSAFAGNNAHIARLAAIHDWITAVAYEPPPGPPSLAARWDQGFRGIATYLLDAADGMAFAAWPAPLLASLRRAQAVLSLNTVPEATAHIRPALAALPDCPVLISHLGLPGAYTTPPSEAAAAARLAPLLALADLPQVGVKVSGLYAVSSPAHAYPHAAAVPFLRVLLDAFGPSRLYWGSDFAPSLDAVSFPQALDVPLPTELSPGERAAIMGENLLRLLRV